MVRTFEGNWRRAARAIVAAGAASAGLTLASASFALPCVHTDAANGSCSFGSSQTDDWGLTSKFYAMRTVSGYTSWVHHAENSSTPGTTLATNNSIKTKVAIFSKPIEPIAMQAAAATNWGSGTSFRGTAFATGYIASRGTFLVDYNVGGATSHFASKTTSVEPFRKTFVSGSYSTELGGIPVTVKGSVVGTVSAGSNGQASYGSFDAQFKRQDSSYSLVYGTASLTGDFKVTVGVEDVLAFGIEGSITFIKFTTDTGTGTTDDVTPYAYGAIHSYGGRSWGREKLTTLDGSVGVFLDVPFHTFREHIYSWPGITIDQSMLWDTVTYDSFISATGFPPNG
jgi:hypothetical protein